MKQYTCSKVTHLTIRKRGEGLRMEKVKCSLRRLPTTCTTATVTISVEFSRTSAEYEGWGEGRARAGSR